MPLSTYPATIPQRPSKAEAVEWRRGLDRERLSPTPTRPSVRSRFQIAVDSLIDRFQPSPSVYTPSRRRRTYRRAKGKLRRLGARCEELFTRSSIPRTTSVSGSRGLGPDDPPNIDVFSSQLASSSSRNTEFSFERQPHPIDAPRLTRKGGALLRHRPNFISGHESSQGQPVKRCPTALSGTTAADSVDTRKTFTTAECIKCDLSFKAHHLIKKSFGSMNVEYHCEDEDEGEKGVDPKESVDFNDEDLVKNLYRKEQIDYKGSVDHNDFDVISGIPCIPPLDFDFEFDFGFEKGGGAWSSQPKSIVT